MLRCHCEGLIHLSFEGKPNRSFRVAPYLETNPVRIGMNCPTENTGQYTEPSLGPEVAKQSLFEHTIVLTCVQPLGCWTSTRNWSANTPLYAQGRMGPFRKPSTVRRVPSPSMFLILRRPSAGKLRAIRLQFFKRVCHFLRVPLFGGFEGKPKGNPFFWGGPLTKTHPKTTTSLQIFEKTTSTKSLPRAFAVKQTFANLFSPAVWGYDCSCVHLNTCLLEWERKNPLS